MEDKKVNYAAYYSLGLTGYEVGVSDDGETAFYRYINLGGGKPYGQRAKIRCTSKGRPYFKANGRRIHLDQCLRKDI